MFIHRFIKDFLMMLALCQILIYTLLSCSKIKVPSGTMALTLPIPYK